MNSQQAKEITDLASYKRVTGAKRFKRTADEMTRGLSPEKALQERINAARGGPNHTQKDDSSPDRASRKQNTQKGPRPSTSRKGNMSLKLRPQAGVDSNYFERVPKSEIQVILDEKWYGWFDGLLDHPYYGNHEKLLEHILNLGIGEVLTTMHTEADVNEDSRS